MQVSVETISRLERKATVTVPGDALEERIEERLRGAAGDLKLPGFRPGRVPLAEVRRRFGATIRKEAVAELTQSSFAEAIERERIALAGQATVDAVEASPGSDLRYTAFFEVLPEVELADLATLTIRQPVAQIEEADIDATVLALREQQAEWHPTDAPVARKHRVRVDFTVAVDGDVVDQSDDIAFVVGEEEAKMHEAVIGATIGETREFPLTWRRPAREEADDDEPAEVAEQPEPEQGIAWGETTAADNAPNLQDAIGKVTVRAVEEANLPEVDDEFMDRFDIEPGEDRPARFRASVRERMELELAAATRMAIRREVRTALAKAHTFELPKAMVLAEYQAEVGRLAKVIDKVPDELRRVYVALAEQNVRIQLVMREIVAREAIRVDDERVRARIEEVANSYEEAAEVRRFLYGDEAQLRRIEEAILEEQVLDLITERAHTLVVPMPYRDLAAGKALPPMHPRNVADADGENALDAEADPEPHGPAPSAPPEEAAGDPPPSGDKPAAGGKRLLRRLLRRS